METYFLIILAILSLVFTGCGRKSESDAQIEWVDPKTIKAGPIRNETLPDSQMLRIQELQKVFAEVDGSPLKKWVEDFKRDLQPEREICIWENMAGAYKAFTAGKNLDLNTKKEVYGVVLTRSGAPEAEVLKHLELKYLTEKQAKEIMTFFTNAPEPIRFISQ